MSNWVTWSKVAIFVTIITTVVEAKAADPYVGSYYCENPPWELVLKRSAQGYKGYVLAEGQKYKVEAQNANGVLRGFTMYDGQPLYWRAELQGKHLHIQSATGYYRFTRQTGKTKKRSAGTVKGTYAKRIASSVLVWSRKGSIALGLGNGSYGEIHFCKNGTFLSYDEHSTTITDRRVSILGASNQRRDGTWSIKKQHGRQKLFIKFTRGNTYSYNMTDVMRGSGKIGQYKLAMDWGKSKCR